MRPLVSLVAVISTDGFISKGVGVPWDLPSDRAHYRAYTQGKWVLVGRRTYEEAIDWFGDRYPLVMAAASYQPRLGQRVGSVEQALALAEATHQRELAVIGGSSVFAAAMPHANKLIITHVDDTLGSGVPFPKIDEHQWHPVSRECHEPDADHAQAFEIVTYKRACQER